MTTIHLEELGEVAHDLVITLMKYDAPLLKNLYHYVPKVTGNKWPPSTIRMALQRHCHTSNWYQGKFDLFEHLDNGCWRLRPGIKIQS